jgi:ribulose-5-phosphate 4-epimerase/fuculose-1-phosphate aldolase
MFGHDVKEDMARVCRILAHHRMIDLWGHLSLRVPRSDLILVTPRFNHERLPRGIMGRDMLVCDSTGRIVEGSGALPPQFAVDLELYRKRADQGACILASPETAVAAGIARCALRPLTHMESSVAYDLRFWESDTLAESPPASGRLAEAIASSSVVQQPGIGVWTARQDILQCLTEIYHLEYLAQANLVAAGWNTAGDTVPRHDSDRLWKQFSGHHHYAEFFASLDPGPLPHPYPAFMRAHEAPDDPHSKLKAAIAFSCRALWERATLVAFLEHISHRLPADNRFLMTASRNFRDMAPEDMCLLDYQANWIDGPRPPNFKWFHAQIMAERRDAQAIVHTHDLLGRVYALGKRTLVPAYRTGLDIAVRPLPMYPRCDLVVDADVRRKTMDALGDGPIVHEAGHGTDFVADTLERALVLAIQREAYLHMHNLAERFGGPRPMSDSVAAQVKAIDPNPLDWWWFYTAEVGAPRRSAGGL